jgi:hypothetical protein
MSNSPKKDTVAKLFADRIRREGREDEWKRVLAAVQTETGLGYGQARWEAMRRLGYQGAEDERRRHEEWLAADKSRTTAVIQSEVQAITSRAEAEFEEALNQLPMTADPQVEVAWIRAHPAMARKARLVNPEERVLITADDVLRSSHGPAPSRSAAIALQNWSDNPGEFNKQLASIVKRTEGGGPNDEGVIEDTGIGEINKMLHDLRVASCYEHLREAVDALRLNGYSVTSPAGEATAIQVRNCSTGKVVIEKLATSQPWPA